MLQDIMGDSSGRSKPAYLKLIFDGVVGSGEIYLDVMRAICSDTNGKSMVDLMCYHAPHTPQLGFAERVYVDVQDRGLDFEEEQQYFVNSDVFDFLGNSKKFDVAICSDGIEHLTENEAIWLLIQMRTKSDKQILFTPLGDNMVDKNATHPDMHKNGLTPRKLEGIKHNHWAYIVMPDFHTDFGAFFFWHCENIKEDFERVSNELKNKSWIKLS